MARTDEERRLLKNKRQRAYYQRNLEQRRAYYRAYREAHIEADRASSRAWRLANLERKRARDRAYGAAHAQERNARNRAWVEANRERQQANYAAWKAKNGERVKAISARAKLTRRAREMNAFVEAINPSVVYERDAGICQICGKVIKGKWQVDHVIPLARGGEHSYANVQLAHPKCNRAKGVKIL